MGITKTKGIVFRRIPYGESSLIIDIFTEEHGLMSYIFGGVRQARSRTGSSLLQVMSLVDLVAYHSERSTLHRIREVRPAYLFRNIPGDVRKNAILLFIAELCSKVIRQPGQQGDLFDVLEDTICTLDQASGQFADAHLIFMIRLADHLGFGPENNKAPENIYFDLLEGRFTSAQPGHEYYTRETGIFDYYLHAARDRGLTSIAIDRITRNRMLDTLLLYFQLHIDRMPEIHGHKVLREVL